MAPTGAVAAANADAEALSRAGQRCCAFLLSAVLLAMCALFGGFSLWVGVFSIPTFFVFLRAAAVCRLSVAEASAQVEHLLEVVRPHTIQSLKLGAGLGLLLIVSSGAGFVVVLEVIRYSLVNPDTAAVHDSQDVEDIFNGIFRLFAALVFTHLAVGLLRLGDLQNLWTAHYAKQLEAIQKANLANSALRSRFFKLGLETALRDGRWSLVYMLPLGGVFESQSIPMPATIGLVVGFVSAKFLVPKASWAFLEVEEKETILPDTAAKTWASKRDKLTDAIISDLARQAQGGSRKQEPQGGRGEETGNGAEERKDGDGRSSKTEEKSERELTTEAIAALFRSSNVPLDEADRADWATKRLLVLKSSRLMFEEEEDSGDEQDKKDEFSDSASHNGNGTEEEQDVDFDGLPPPPTTGPRLRGGLASIMEDEEGYIDRGGYSYDPEDDPRTMGYSHDWASAGSRDSKAPLGKARMESFQHRYLASSGRNPSQELNAIERGLTQIIESRRDVVKGFGSRNGRPAPPPPGVSAPSVPPGTASYRSSNNGDAEAHSPHAGDRAPAGGANLSALEAGDASARPEAAHESEAAGSNGPGWMTGTMVPTLIVSVSCLVIMLCSAGLTKLGVIDLANTGLFGDWGQGTIWETCGCCTPTRDGNSQEQFFAVLNEQFGYTCTQFTLGGVAWLVYWVYPIVLLLFKFRALCFSGIARKDAPLAASGPSRRGAAAPGMARRMWRSQRSTSFLAGNLPDPAWVGRHPTAKWIKLSAFVNLFAGVAYIWWRAAYSMPDDPVSPVWNWFFFAGECILMVGVFTSHLQRCFPAVRELCNMDDLISADNDLNKEATVCIMVPTAGEKMRNLKHVIVGAYSQRLWASTLPARDQLRVAILDEKGRHEVLELAEKVYKLAEILATPAVRKELSDKLDEPNITPKVFLDFFNQMDALDKYVFSRACHPAFDMALKIDQTAGAPAAHMLKRATSTVLQVRKQKPKASKPKERLPKGFTKPFASNDKIPSIMYSARANPGMPKASPKAGNMNAAIFPVQPGVEPVVGHAAKVVVVNDARHRLKSEFLQRTVPYFFKLSQTSRNKYEWGDVGFVQVPQRFEDLGDGDPLGNHAIMTFFIANVSKDGQGGVTSCGQGSLWRVDALRGMSAAGEQTCDSDADPSIIGHDCGFRAEVLIEDTHTSLEFFKRQWRSAYVCEPGETLAVCVEQPNTVAWRVKQVFRWHLGAVQLLLKDGLGFLCFSKMPTVFHKMFGLDSLTYYVQAVGGMFIIFMPIAFSISQETPFDTQKLQFIYFFFPYIITATIPTLLSVGWKNVNPNAVLTDEQFWLSTCYVQVWAFVLGVKNRVTCQSPDNAWNLVCPTWPLGLLFFALGWSAINTTVHWIYVDFAGEDKWIWFASFGASLVVMSSLWPMVKLWWPGQPALPAAYYQKFILILIFIALTSVLATFLS